MGQNLKVEEMNEAGAEEQTGERTATGKGARGRIIERIAPIGHIVQWTAHNRLSTDVREEG